MSTDVDPADPNTGLGWTISVEEGTKVAWTPDDIPDQHGRGRGHRREQWPWAPGHPRSCRQGARVVMAARDQGKANKARRLIAADVPDADLEIRELDLASLGSVRACADGIVDAYQRIDLLVNNAGVMAVPQQATAEGFEMQLSVNHLGHFVLTRRLLPALLAAPAARVVSVTSFARLTGWPVDPDNPHLRGRYNPWRAYGQAKLVNLQFAVGCSGGLRRRVRAYRAWPRIPGCPTPTCRRAACGRAADGASGSGTCWPVASACRPPAGRSHCCAPPPTPMPAGASCMDPGGERSGHRCAGLSSAVRWAAPPPRPCGRSPSARPGSASTSQRSPAKPNAIRLAGSVSTNSLVSMLKPRACSIASIPATARTSAGSRRASTNWSTSGSSRPTTAGG